MMQKPVQNPLLAPYNNHTITIQFVTVIVPLSCFLLTVLSTRIWFQK